LLAEANGLTGSETLTVGTTLIVPGGVSSAHNTSETFAVYDPNKALGANDPTAVAQIAPPAKKHGGCGIVGKILIIAIAVAVAAVIGPEVIAGFQAAFAGLGAAAATVAGAVVGGAVTGAISSVVSQGFGVATGIQDKFSWKGVAMAALAGGIGAGVGQLGSLKGLSGLAGKGFVAGAARSVISNVATQGVAVATGLQKKFDWAGVAVAGVVGGVSAGLGKALKVDWDPKNFSIGNTVNMFATQAVAGLAGAATRSVLTGTSFAKNLEAVLPDVIGSTIGNMVAAGVAAADRQIHSDRQRERIAGLPGFRGASTSAIDEANRMLIARDDEFGLDPGDSFDLKLNGNEEIQQVVRTAAEVTVRTDESAYTGAQIEDAARAQMVQFYDMAPEDADEILGQARSHGLGRGRVEPADLSQRAKLVGMADDDEIVVTGNHPRVLGDLGDHALEGAGRTAEYIADAVGTRPWLRIGLKTLSVLLGPVSAAAGAIIDKSPIGAKIDEMAGQAVEYVANKYRDSGYSAEFSKYAGIGALAVAGIAAGVLSGGLDRTFNIVNRGLAAVGRIMTKLTSGFRAAKGITLKFDKAARTWTTPEGLVYGPGSAQGNRVKHVLEHTIPNAKKPLHTLFNVDRNQVLGLVDEAWAKRGTPLPNDPGAYVIPMGRVIGQAGETSIKIVVRPGTSTVITAYPVR
jgi:hypothetical protein